METLLEEPVQARRELDRAQGVLEGARKRYKETVASRKTTPARIREAQEAQERARDVCEDATARTAAAVAHARAAACSTCPRMFVALHRAQERVCREGAALLADTQAYCAEFAHACSAADGVQQRAPADCTTSAAAQGLEALRRTERQIVRELGVLAGAQTRCTAAQPRAPARDVAALFADITALRTAHGALLAALDAPLPSEGTTVAEHVANAVAPQLPEIAKHSVALAKGQGALAACARALRRCKGATDGETGGTEGAEGKTDASQLLGQACRHAHTLKVAVQRVFDAVPSEDAGWGALHGVLGALADLLDRVDDLLVEAEHAKQLQRVRARVPALDDAIGDNPARVFLFDSDVAVVPDEKDSSSSDSSSSELIPLSPVNPHAGSTRRKGALWLPNHMFLFSDFLVVGARDDSAAGEQGRVLNEYNEYGYDESDDEEEGTGAMGAMGGGHERDKKRWKVTCALPLYDLTVESVSENDSSNKEQQEQEKKQKKHHQHQQQYHYFRIKSGTKEATVAVGSSGQEAAWVRALGAAASSRRATQVYGVPVAAIMARATERGRDVPNAVEDLMAAVEAPACVGAEGVYRVSSAARDVLRVRGRLDAGRRVRFADAHTPAAALKLWLRALPVPLLGAAPGSAAAWGSVATVADARALVAALPPAHAPVLAALVRHIRAVAAHEAQNRMGVANLAIIFTPSILPPPDPADAVTAAELPASPLPFLVAHYDEIFAGALAPMACRDRAHSLAVRPDPRRDAQLRARLAPLRAARPPLPPLPQQKQQSFEGDGEEDESTSASALSQSSFDETRASATSGVDYDDEDEEEEVEEEEEEEDQMLTAATDDSSVSLSVPAVLDDGMDEDDDDYNESVDDPTPPPLPERQPVVRSASTRPAHASKPLPTPSPGGTGGAPGQRRSSLDGSERSAPFHARPAARATIAFGQSTSDTKPLPTPTPQPSAAAVRWKAAVAPRVAAQQKHRQQQQQQQQ